MIRNVESITTSHPNAHPMRRNESAVPGQAPIALGEGIAKNAPRKWLVFLLVAAAVFMSSLDSSIVNIALPVIMTDFEAPLTIIEWMPMIYLLFLAYPVLYKRPFRHRLHRGGVSDPASGEEHGPPRSFG